MFTLSICTISLYGSSKIGVEIVHTRIIVFVDNVLRIHAFCFSMHFIILALHFSRVDLVQLPGKRNRCVPVLITPDVKQAMDQLVDKRQQSHVSISNPYFFANSSSRGHIDSWQVLNSVCTAAGLTKPHLVTSTNLSKYIATVTQVNHLALVFHCIHSKLDYCNSLYYKLPKSELSRLQQIQNSLAHTVVKAPKSCHITPIIRSLHWLRITQRIEYKLLSLTYKVLTTTQPPYLYNLMSV